MEHYSVLMTVYHKEKPEFLKESIQSMLDQTVRTNDFVIVCDGPLTPPLDRVLEMFQRKNLGLFHVVRLPKNVGIGPAANEGVRVCANELIAKMDSDDFSRPERCAVQLGAFEEDPSLSVVGSALSEFMGDRKNVVSIKKVPLSHEEIKRYARRRDPFNNQTVMFRKSAVLKIGGYADKTRCEDYDLYLRLLQAGCKTKNIDQVLVDYRLTPDVYKRRGSWINTREFFRLHWGKYRGGFGSFWDFAIPCAGQAVICLIPPGLRKKFYEKILRN